MLSNRGVLLQYCQRVQETHQIWPTGPSFLFGVLSFSELATGKPLRVHSWRQSCGISPHRKYDEEQEDGSEGEAHRFLCWLGAAACCATLLVVAGKTPLRLARVGNQGHHSSPHEDHEE